MVTQTVSVSCEKMHCKQKLNRHSPFQVRLSAEIFLRVTKVKGANKPGLCYEV